MFGGTGRFSVENDFLLRLSEDTVGISAHTCKMNGSTCLPR